jgi:hypothetical protein
MNGCKHDFESNEDSEYCANGCGEKRLDNIILTLHHRIKELEEILEDIIGYNHSDNCNQYGKCDCGLDKLQKYKEKWS